MWVNVWLRVAQRQPTVVVSGRCKHNSGISQIQLAMSQILYIFF